MKITTLALAATLVACGGSTTSTQAPLAPSTASASPVASAPEAAPAPVATNGAAVPVANAASSSASPVAAASDTSGHGNLDPLEIRRVVRAVSKKIGYCYGAGLVRNPQLTGRVSVRFEIDPTGAVSQANDDGSTMPDPRVIKCVVGEIGKLSFPAPQGGSVTVRYPFDFTYTGNRDAGGK